MKEKMVKRTLRVMIAMFVFGIILILSSPSIGEGIGSDVSQTISGMTTSRYYMIVQTNASSFRTFGLTLSLIGGFGTLLSGYVLYKEL